MKQRGAINIKLICAMAGVPEPVAEVKFHPVRKWRFDYAWPDRMLALEIEGGVWIQGRHNRAYGYTNDCEKYSHAAILGWRILRCTRGMVSDFTIVELLRLAFKAPEKEELVVKGK